MLYKEDLIAAADAAEVFPPGVPGEWVVQGKP